MPNSESRLGFVRKLALLLLPFAVVGAWLELKLRDLPTTYHQKRLGFIQAAPGLELLVLGTSEAFQGVDPSRLGPHAYSLANVAQSLYYDRNLLAWAMARAPKLRQVLLGASYHSLGYRLQGTVEGWRSVEYYRDFGILPEEGLRGLDFRYLSGVLFYEPLVSLRWALTGQGLDSPTLSAEGQDRLGCPSADDADIKINALTARRRASTHESMTHLEAMDENLAQLQGLLNLAAERGVKVSLFLPPVTASYAAAINAERRAAMTGRLRAFAAEKGLPLKDYFQDPRFNDSDFFDVDHLCRRGAEKLSNLLARDLLR